jgi:hypothetical protein
MGMLADSIGIQLSVALGAALCILLITTIAVRSKALRTI